MGQYDGNRPAVYRRRSRCFLKSPKRSFFLSIIALKFEMKIMGPEEGYNVPFPAYLMACLLYLLVFCGIYSADRCFLCVSICCVQISPVLSWTYLVKFYLVLMLSVKKLGIIQDC